MIHAYSELFLDNAMDNLGTAVECAVRYCHMDGQEFLNLFSASGLAADFGRGDIALVAGMSGIELARKVFVRSGKEGSWSSFAEELQDTGYPPEYWVGQALAYYQWEKNTPFPRLIRQISYEDVIDLYAPLHEADMSRTVREFDFLYSKKETRLAQARKRAGLSQSQLARAADVSVRSIQFYEQRKSDIQNAQLNRLRAIARALQCEVSDIVEA